MTTTALVPAAEEELVARSLRALNRSLTTSSVCTADQNGSRPVLMRYSTSPSRGCDYQLIIVDANRAVRAAVDDGRWVIEKIAEANKTDSFQNLDTISDINWFRQTIELGMSDIASLFGVTRKAVYDWLDGAKPQKADYIKAVRSLIERELDKSSQPYLQQFWDFAPNGGPPLLEILRSGDPARLDTAAVSALRELAAPIDDYVKKVRSEQSSPAVPHLHNYDEYRNL